ncbi:class I SAM-dependent methyltransferase [Salinibacter ruber]|jgi:SAM-dependent methyltransferase|uniref:SAM-dependent methyltransferase n=1 Tax=Salinibacter ruber TaxID=146919 RepID=A0A9X2Q3Q0_9BACT|nr:class I SAM-dependent methyltransferase [Salinibacter ruber]MCS3661145.1 SAM-dependent methyltransferase [Salinibacter ruber]MCS3710944.1 SAM-dependent methyltransferase [Salinibacter ruber]
MLNRYINQLSIIYKGLKSRLSNAKNNIKKVSIFLNWIYYTSYFILNVFVVKFILSGVTRKRNSALTYWLKRKAVEGKLSNDHYEYIYTDHVAIEKDYFDGKYLLDIGCGPRGTLEWCDNAERKIGLDPISSKYKNIGASNHDMEYFEQGSENIPFEDGYFDVVFCVNAIDHVSDIEKSIEEIKRVTKKGGKLIVITELGGEVDVRHPHSLGPEIVEMFGPEFKVEFKECRKLDGGGVNESAWRGTKVNCYSIEEGVITVKYERI